METRLRLLIVLAGLPEPVLQHPVRCGSSGRGYRLDLAWPTAKVALEYDGRHHVEREGQWRGDLRRREDLEGQGWRFVVAIAAEVYATPDATIRRVESALRRNGLRTRTTSTEWRRHFPSSAAA
jgi:hypothetical protein